jgi:hypothetical protein
MTTEACSGRNPSACDDDSVSAAEHRQERSWHGVRCSGRALERSELPGRRLAACRHDRNTPGGDEGCKSEAPHLLAPSPNIEGSMTYDCKSVAPGVRYVAWASVPECSLKASPGSVGDGDC